LLRSQGGVAWIANGNTRIALDSRDDTAELPDLVMFGHYPMAAGAEHTLKLINRLFPPSFQGIFARYEPLALIE
jgi:hypothetical protein